MDQIATIGAFAFGLMQAYFLFRVALPTTYMGKTRRYARANANRQVWMLRRNCALSPRQSLLSMGLLAALTPAIATPFAIGEAVAIGGCFLMYARRAVDYDCVVLTGRRLEVTRCDGAKLRRYDWNPRWATVAFESGRNPGIRIRHGGDAASIGRHVTLAQRRYVATEANRALTADARRPPVAAATRRRHRACRWRRSRPRSRARRGRRRHPAVRQKTASSKTPASRT
ncbi:DUF2244 domain-containing protein [Burkholderia humptydooensis]|uniref:DUF2244 domain-containing protein n=1 Tax=Burkholderia humptydooensis TaxID=430531 RepID=A0A7T2U980_9BURK|nr:DUF2244 domain-containing protein [Burkholderia humptydooensis]